MDPVRDALINGVGSAPRAPVPGWVAVAATTHGRWSAVFLVELVAGGEMNVEVVILVAASDDGYREVSSGGTARGGWHGDYSGRRYLGRETPVGWMFHGGGEFGADDDSGDTVLVLAHAGWTTEHVQGVRTVTSLATAEAAVAPDGGVVVLSFGAAPIAFEALDENGQVVGRVDPYVIDR